MMTESAFMKCSQCNMLHFKHEYHKMHRDRWSLNPQMYHDAIELGINMDIKESKHSTIAGHNQSNQSGFVSTEEVSMAKKGESYKDIYSGSGKIDGLDQQNKAVRSCNFLNAVKVKELDLEGQELTITAAEVKEIGDRDKIVLSFEGNDNTLVVNSTNANIMGEAFGDNYTKWPGKAIKLTLTKVRYQGALVDSVQVQPQ